MSRTDARSNRLRRRPSRTVPATIVGFVLLAVAVGLVWITVLRLLNGAWPAFLGGVNDWITALTWGSTIAVALSVATAVIGVILLIAAWKPGQPTALTLQPARPPDQSTISPRDDGGTTEFVMTRHAVARLATAYADTVDGVDSVSAAVTAHKVSLVVKSGSEQRRELEATVTGRVRDALEGAGLNPMPTVSTV
ncbi:MAG TPA: DUF6286 domain-containing protein, partial [Microlunatus sp.]|nr:DUF6286 domain-containing protein [Microlunatus sp.]